MNKDVETALAKMIEGITNATTKAADFAAEQIPDVLNQVLVYNLAQSVILIVLSITIIILSYLWAFKWSNQETNSYGDWEESKVLAVSLSACLASGAILLFIDACLTATKIILAPKLYLLEYAAHLLK